MDYRNLLELVTELGYRLAISGAETFRVEESILRITKTYQVKSEVFAIPNCLHVSIETAEGQPMTLLRRIGHHDNDLDAVEKYSNLSRKICVEKPDIDTALQWLNEVEANRRKFHFILSLLGCFLGSVGFSVLFGGSYLDCLWSGICGLIIGALNRFMDTHRVNAFFKTIASAFAMAVFAYGISCFGLTTNTESVIIGALMILVPGLLFTNAMRDIIYGDTNSGINRIVQVFLTAAAIALGTGVALTVVNGFVGQITIASATYNHPFWHLAIACLAGCYGFTFLFNIHGHGKWLCAIGGVLAFSVFFYTQKFIHNTYAAYLLGTAFASLYAEIMARIRKYPAISYLVVSIFPLVPGAGVYNMMKFAVQGNMSDFANSGMETIAIAGVMAAGILMISTSVKLISGIKQKA